MEIEQIQILCQTLTIYFIIISGPLAFLFFLRKRFKNHSVSKFTSGYTIDDIPRAVEENRDNVARVLVVITQNGVERFTFVKPSSKQLLFPEEGYSLDEMYKLCPCDGSIIYEYLVVEKRDNTAREYSGKTYNYMNIQNIIDKAKINLGVPTEPCNFTKAPTVAGYSVGDVPRIIQGNRKNVVRVLAVIGEEGMEIFKVGMPPSISAIIRPKAKEYPPTEFYKACPCDGSIIYEYLIVDIVKGSPNEYSGATHDYMDIQNKIDEINAKINPISN